MLKTGTSAASRWWLPAGRWVLIALLLLIGVYFRFTGLNWDEGQWIHPDEGHMRIITSVIEMPDSLSLYFDTQASPLNSRNSGYVYSYGTLPLFLTRLMGEWLDNSCASSKGIAVLVRSAFLPAGMPAMGTQCRPGTFTGPYSALVGRTFSALADVGTLLLMYLLGRRLYGEAVGILALALGALTAFSIQQSHFFTVDSMACFFTILTAYFSVRGAQSSLAEGLSWGDFGVAGIATGLAAASKISAALAALFVVFAGIWWWLRSFEAERGYSPVGAVRSVALRLVLAGLLCLLVFRIAQPYAFEGPGFFDVIPSAEWLERLGRIRAEQSGEIDLPSGRQWTNRAPILFPWRNMVIWGMGFPLGLAAWTGWALMGIELLGGRRRHFLLWSWTTLIFLYLATRWVTAMRYFLPLYPLLTIMAAYGLIRTCRAKTRRWRRLGIALTALTIAGTAVWAIAVFSIYLRPHTRIAASRWIYATVPPGATVANEHWDWGLPLRIDGRDPFGAGTYTGIEMQHYNEDTPAKRSHLLEWLNQADYIFLASNRLYASIPRLPGRYPLTTTYYRALFSGALGFELAADFTSRPALGPVQFPDQELPFPLMEAAYVHQRQPITVWLPPAEESFSVYDHPRVLIFRKTADYSPARVEEILDTVDLSTVQHGRTPREATTTGYLLIQNTSFLLVLSVLLFSGVALYRSVHRTKEEQGLPYHTTASSIAKSKRAAR